MNKPEKNPDGSAGVNGAKVAEEQNLEKIRDILFGSPMKDFEKKLNQLEGRLEEESSTLRGEFERRFDTLESYVKDEVRSLVSRFKAEQGERIESVEKLVSEIRNLTKAFETKAGELEEQVEKAQQDLREKILDQSKTLEEEIRTRHDNVSTAIKKSFQELNAGKISRSALADIFKELALRLSDESAMKLDSE